MFQDEAFLHVIDEEPDEDCDSNSSISVETVKDATLPCHSATSNTPLHAPETQLEPSLVITKDSPDSTLAHREYGTELCDDVTVNNTMNQNPIIHELTRPLQLVHNGAIASQESSVVFSQDQVVTEIIASGSRMVDEVKELISELLDACVQSRGNDGVPVAGHGDFEDTSATPSSATHTYKVESTETEHGAIIQRTGISESFDPVETDISICSLSDESGQCIDQRRENEEPPALEISSQINVCDNQYGNNELPSDKLDISDNQCGGNDQPLHLETVVDGEILRGSSNNQRQLGMFGSPESKPKPETQLENVISDIQCDITEDDDDRNLTDRLLTSHQHISDTVEEDGTSTFISDNMQHEPSAMLCCTEVWPVSKIEGYDLADVEPMPESTCNRFDQESTQLVKIIGVDINPESQTEEAPLDSLASDGVEIREDMHTPFQNHIVKIVGIDVENPILDVDHTNLCDIKIIGVNIESPLPVVVASDCISGDLRIDEEGDSTRYTDLSPSCDGDENEAMETEVTNKDVPLGDGDTICDDVIFQDAEGNGIKEPERLDTETSEFCKASHSGYKDAADDAMDEASGHDEAKPHKTIQRTARNQEIGSPSDCSSVTSDGSNVSASSSSPRSSFEILYHQDVSEDGSGTVPYSPTTSVPSPQEEYNEEFMSPEFEVDDIIVNFATVSAMGDVAPQSRRSGTSPVAPPDPVQFEDVNSRSPSPLPQNDLTLLDCLFDICEDRLQGFPFKIVPPGLESFINQKSNPLELSPDCLGEQGDIIQNMDNQRSSGVSKELFGSRSGDDEGFFCCDSGSIESHGSFTSDETIPERPLVAGDSSEMYFSFEEFFDAGEESFRQEKDSSPEIVPEPAFQPNPDDQRILFGFVCSNQESEEIHPMADETITSRGTKKPTTDNQIKLEKSTVTLDSAIRVALGKEEDDDENFVFFLALFTLSSFVYCQYGTRILRTIMHWIWICQLIFQLLSDS